MTPFVAVGMSLAMMDALERSKAIVKNKLLLARALKGYEESMFHRGALYAQKTWGKLE